MRFGNVRLGISYVSLKMEPLIGRRLEKWRRVCSVEGMKLPILDRPNVRETYLADSLCNVRKIKSEEIVMSLLISLLYL
jgi:hypothetical protein